MTNLYYGTVKQLLERISSVMVDYEAISHLIVFVKEALNGEAILEELGKPFHPFEIQEQMLNSFCLSSGLDSATAGERGLRLLMVLAYVFPSHFLYQDVLTNLISLLKLPGEFVAPFTLSVLTFVGKHKPMGETFPGLVSVRKQKPFLPATFGLKSCSFRS